MKLTLSLMYVPLMAAAALATQLQKPVIVSYPENTPNSVLEEAKEAIRRAGGAITHEYHLIKAFAANAPAKVLETVQAMGTQSEVLIEEDQTITVNES